MIMTPPMTTCSSPQAGPTSQGKQASPGRLLPRPGPPRYAPKNIVDGQGDEDNGLLIMENVIKPL